MAKEIVFEESLFPFIHGYTDGWADELPDGAWFAVHEEAVQAFNEEHGTDLDFCDVHTDYFSWLEIAAADGVEDE